MGGGIEHHITNKAMIFLGWFFFFFLLLSFLFIWQENLDSISKDIARW